MLYCPSTKRSPNGELEKSSTYCIRPSAVAANYIDLSKIDFELLKKQFETGRKDVEAQKLRSQIAAKVAQMVQLNRTRMNFLEEFQKMIEEYNSGAANIETFELRPCAPP